jgi:uncharacterized protein
MILPEPIVSKEHFLLFYEVVEDYSVRRIPFRSQHLALAAAAALRGELLLGGAFANPVDGAVLLFSGDGPEVAEAFAKNDPYVQNGLVSRWYIRSWTVVAGCLFE